MAAETLYRKIYDDLLAGIQDGTFREGDRLPSEKELADQYGVSRITSKKALEMLADKGHVFRRPGRGTFVSAPVKDYPDPGEGAADASGESETDEPEKSPSIGIIMDSMSPSFGMEVLSGLEYECHRIGLLPYLSFTYGSIEKEQKAIQDMIRAGVSGIVLVCVQDKAYNEEILKLYVQHFPVILVDRRMPGIALPVVTTDNYKAAYELTELLMDAGHTRIGYISHSHMETSTIATRFHAFCDAMHARGLPVDSANIMQNMDAYIPKDDDEAVNIRAYKKELSDFIDTHTDLTAYFTVEFSIAVLLDSVLREKGLRDKRQIVYFDGLGELPSPIADLPHILQNQFQMGVQAIRNLERRIRGEEIPQCEFIPYTLTQSDAMLEPE